jgi:two-component system phosphate regulon sensor histidine kinase PhoR
MDNHSEVKMNLFDLAKVVHDLKNPLSAIIAAVEVLKDGSVTKNTHSELCRMIDVSSKNILEFIDEILALSKIESEEGINFDKTCNVAEVIKGVVSYFESSTKDKNISISVDAENDLVLKIPAVRVKQILNNMIANAVKYNKSGGKIHVSAHKEDDRVCIWICDTGIGIPIGERDKIFNKFYRSKGRHVEGSGLGLSIVNEIVDVYGGEITIDNQNCDTGSKFTLIFPSE